MAATSITNDSKTLKTVFTSDHMDNRYNCDGKVANGLVVYLPQNHQVFLSKYDKNNPEKRILDYRTCVPHVIMVHHHEKNLLQIPGGKVDSGETYLDAVNREWTEEVMGCKDYKNISLKGEPVFRETDFVNITKAYGKLTIAHFIRIIHDPVVYSNLVSEAGDRYSKRLLPWSNWVTLDTMGIFSMPIFMEPVSKIKTRTPGLPMSLDNVHINHKDTLVRSLLYPIKSLNGNSILDAYSAKEFLNRLDKFKVHQLSSKKEIIRIMSMIEESGNYIETLL